MTTTPSTTATATIKKVRKLRKRPLPAVTPTVTGPDKMVQAILDARLPARCRKVTPSDLDRATAAAAAAFRASLEGTRPKAYVIEELTATVTYSYLHHIENIRA